MRAGDIVITMGCGDARPILADRRYLDRPVTDQVDKPIAVVRAIGDEIDAHSTEPLRAMRIT
ncbi:hypothetical protein [Streptomyces sp. NPDC002516]